MAKTTAPSAKATASRPPSRRHIALMQPMARGRYKLRRVSSRIVCHNDENEEPANKEEHEEEDIKVEDDNEDVKEAKDEEDDVKIEDMEEIVTKEEDQEEVMMEQEPVVEETHEEAMAEAPAVEEYQDEDEDDCAILVLVHEIAQDVCGVLVEESAMPCLRDLARCFLERYSANGAVIMRHARRRTLRVSDVRDGLHHGNPYMMHDYIPDIIAKYSPKE
ncbi:hypothetical protein AGABI2DRAFT_119858 [Agaricus bisporus var. bisporus H97]|uniref:hypothetical protein n=1 Tax=Agaricus bisporus var. bisporus (strain H97 / ATCC MYA-4626 / FGSC 10389) TaxID=936046 RepID=UPI00029F7CEB|nr:hypothetical protein AGABI2DRAFT_119858 [Agaricus bisporus var. bisporus H97]EKV44901.1 hypothetical protein AGABI2DRAFT_119858 [Agaricus bisporus var. bisporus H97]